MPSSDDTAWVAQRAKALGFDLCGVVRAEKFPELAQTEEWLARGYAGEMRYLADPRRSDPAKAVPKMQSLIVCALHYNTGHLRSIEAPSDGQEPRGWISRYAWGRDYHEVLSERLEELASALHQHFQEPFETRVYTDTGPLQERVLAKYAGLGWLGKNTLLLNRELGSWIFLGTILTTLELVPTRPPETPPPDLCGNCRRCLDVCPTGALVEPYVMDARRCIAYLTIELRGSIPEEFRERIGRHVFGCDICQDVCPWNRRSPVTDEEGFQPRTFVWPKRNGNAGCETEDQPATPIATEQSLLLPRLEWLASLTPEEHRKVFRGSPVKRAKWNGLVRNACIALGNSTLDRSSPAYQRIARLLKRLCLSKDAVIAESAQWALSRIQ
jgi:epoxyqueuosine reductase